MNRSPSPADLALSNLMETLLEALRNTPHDGVVYAALRPASASVIQAAEQWRQHGVSAAAGALELLRLAAREIKRLDDSSDRSDVRLLGSCRRSMSRALLEIEAAAGVESRSDRPTSH
jgi:hypothetical protein